MTEIDGFEKYFLEGRASAGDQILKTFALMLRQIARPVDIIGRTDQAEFALLLPETSREDAKEMGQRIRRMTGRNFTVSAGLACFPEHAYDATSLFQMARSAIKMAQSWGGDSILTRR